MTDITPKHNNNCLTDEEFDKYLNNFDHEELPVEDAEAILRELDTHRIPKETREDGNHADKRTNSRNQGAV